jgi:osmoprotectant transport system ATP-binding protein
MLELLDVSKQFGRIEAVHNVNFRAALRQTTVLIGPSGCGKSTLLRLMIGLLKPDAGQVRFEGEVLNPSNVAAIRRRMGYVIQDGGLFPHLTARGNVTLMARHLGLERDRIEARLRELAELSKFPVEGLDRYPVQLSGGQRQRVSLMRALILDPDVLLLDEPLGALDPMIRTGLQDDLREIFRSLGKTVVMVTHDTAEAAFFGEAIVLMREGRIIQQGRFADLVDAPAEPFVSHFMAAQRRMHTVLAETTE